MDKIGTVSAVAFGVSGNGDPKLLILPHHQALNFSLTDGNNIDFQIRKVGEQGAEITDASLGLRFDWRWGV